MKLDRNRKKWVAAIAVLVATTFVAGPTWAHGGKRHHRDHDRYERHHDHHRYDKKHRHGHYGSRHHRHDECRRGDRDHRRWERRHHRRHHRHSDRRYPVYSHSYGNHDTRYYCAPCKGHFKSYDDLSYHVHHRHRVPLWKVPFLIVRGVLDGIFGFTYHGH